MTKVKELTKFLYELGNLQRVKRSGYWVINVKDPESVAEHSQRSAMIAYFLAKLEDADCYKSVVMSLFHDSCEARLNDLHKVGQKYIDFKAAEKKVYADQFGALGEMGSELSAFMDELMARETKEANVARDADLLDNALSARELIKIGHEDAQNWIDNIWKVIKTENGKKLLKMIEEVDPNDWWRELKNITR